MGVHFVRWALLTGQAVAEDSTTVRDRLRHAEVDVVFAADTQPVPGPGLVAGLTTLHDVHVVRVNLYGPTPGATPTVQEFLDRDAAATHYGTTTAPPHNNDLNAVGYPALNDTMDVGSAGMITVAPLPYIRLAGPALAAWSTLPPTVVRASVDFTDRFPGVARGHTEFGGFVNDTDDLVGVSNTSAALLKYLQFRTGGFSFTNQGATINVPDASYASVAPTGEVWLRSSQIGNNPNQLPPFANLNTAERYTFFPAVFMRNFTNFTALTSVGPRRDAPITTTRGPLLIWQVNRAPTHSRWGIILNGCPIDVIIAHPQGSDFRTPIEIWSNVWVPALRGPGAYTVPIHRVDQAGGTNTFEVIGQLDRKILGEVLSYARFLEVYDADLTIPILTMVPQN